MWGVFILCFSWLFAIFYLLTWLPVGQKKRFAKIDRLISRVVYDFENVDEIAVLRLLELQVIGIRYGRYLSENAGYTYIS